MRERYGTASHPSVVFALAVCLGRPFRLHLSRQRTVSANWLLIVLATSVAFRSASLVLLGGLVGNFLVPPTTWNSPSQIQCDNEIAFTGSDMCTLMDLNRLLEVIISSLSFVAASRALPHMGFATHARAFLAAGEMAESTLWAVDGIARAVRWVACCRVKRAQI